MCIYIYVYIHIYNSIYIPHIYVCIYVYIHVYIISHFSLGPRQFVWICPSPGHLLVKNHLVAPSFKYVKDLKQVCTPASSDTPMGRRGSCHKCVMAKEQRWGRECQRENIGSLIIPELEFWDDGLNALKMHFANPLMRTIWYSSRQEKIIMRYKTNLR